MMNHVIIYNNTSLMIFFICKRSFYDFSLWLDFWRDIIYSLKMQYKNHELYCKMRREFDS